MAKSVLQYIHDEPLVEYEPQRDFLKLYCTADEKAIGTKYGISFHGEWVWKFKHYLDTSFMHLLDPHYLFKDYKKQGCKQKLPYFSLFEDVPKKQLQAIETTKKKVSKMNVSTATAILQCQTTDANFQEGW